MKHHDVSLPDAELTEVSVIGRNHISAITSVTVDGQLHRLGEHRDFRRHSILKHFLPEEGRHSFSWVQLRDGEILDNHEHPTKSMILVCRGSAQLTGDSEQMLTEGDIICVPPGKKHGFHTVPGQVFHGLSVQFEGEGLYENEHSPRVKFSAALNDPYAELDMMNASLLKRHSRNSLFRLFDTDTLRKDDVRRQRFLESLYVWSRYFQKMLFMRQAVCADESLLPLYSGHLRDEFGHDELLKTQNNLTGGAYDPVLEAASLWFINKMFSGNEAEKIVIIHMVIESSGHLFGEATKALFARASSEGDSYFDVHAEADEDHSTIGRPYLQQLAPDAFPGLMETCSQAWEQMDLVHERIAAMTLADTPLSRQMANQLTD